MCGIFGLIAKDRNKYTSHKTQKVIKTLFKLSESRGKEAAGLAVKSESAIDVLKSPLSASDFLKSNAYKIFISDVLKDDGENGPLAIIGHSRLATHGSEYKSQNNQPVIKQNAACVHNGIIANDSELWQKYPELKKESEVDTEIFLALLQLFFKDNGSLPLAVKKVFKAIEGSASVAALFNNNYSLLLATNTGSVYFCVNKNNDVLIFGSERYILEEFIDKVGGIDAFDKEKIEQISPGAGLLIDIRNLNMHKFSFLVEAATGISPVQEHKEINFLDHSRNTEEDVLEKFLINTKNYVLTPESRRAMTEVWERIYEGDGLKRCKKCLLPESMTFIDFDGEGVCNYCRDYKKIEYLGEEEFEKIVSPYRRDDGKPDCFFLFSGGRDSSYGLHYLKKVLKMNPIAFTYDWGVLTDLGRRNEARMCGELGVEHIIISADIRKKRNYIRKNVEAWMKKPALGMVPLFMAGDKELLKQIEWLKKKTKLEISIDSGAPSLETDLIKIGFAGIKLMHSSRGEEYSSMSVAAKLKLIKYYSSQYLTNPSYINISLFDTAFAFYCSFIFHLKSYHMFKYIKWDENEILSTIINKYKWEKEKDTSVTWRIDDGTAPFYNYIYMTAAGLNENDIFRSIQIREGQIDRETAYDLIKEENKPRFDSLEWYGKIIGFDLNEAIRRINLMPKRYKI